MNLFKYLKFSVKPVCNGCLGLPVVFAVSCGKKTSLII